MCTPPSTVIAPPSSIVWTVRAAKSSRSEVQCEIGFAASDLDRQVEGRSCINIADMGETLCAEQLLSDTLGSDANAGEFQKTHGGCFEGLLRGQRSRSANEAPGADRRERGQKAASGL